MICRGEYWSGAGEALVSLCAASLLLLQQNGAKSNFLFWIKCMYRKQFSVKIFIQIHHFFLSLNSFFLRRSPFQTGQSRVADPDPTFSKKNLNYSGSNQKSRSVSNQNIQIRIQPKHPDPDPTKTSWYGSNQHIQIRISSTPVFIQQNFSFKLNLGVNFVIMAGIGRESYCKKYMKIT